MSEQYDLLIDVGNTFIKWGRYRAGGVTTSEAAAIDNERRLIDEIATIGPVFAGYAPPRHIVISNVAGTRVRNPLMRAMEVWPGAPGAWHSLQLLR